MEYLDPLIKQLIKKAWVVYKKKIWSKYRSRMCFSREEHAGRKHGHALFFFPADFYFQKFYFVKFHLNDIDDDFLYSNNIL